MVEPANVGRYVSCPEGVACHEAPTAAGRSFVPQDDIGGGAGRTIVPISTGILFQMKRDTVVAGISRVIVWSLMPARFRSFDSVVSDSPVSASLP